MPSLTAYARRSPFQISLRGLLLLTAVLAMLLAAWNWRWEEELPGGANRLWVLDFEQERLFILSVDDVEPGILSSQVTAVMQRDWRFRKVPTGFVSGYDSQHRKQFEATYDERGSLQDYRVFDEQGQIRREGGYRGKLWLTRAYSGKKSVIRESSRDRQGVQQGRFVYGTDEWILLDGHLNEGKRTGKWQEVIGQQNLLVNEQWDQGQRQGEWKWTSLVDQSSFTTQYADSHLVAVNGVDAPTAEFLEWLRRSIQHLDTPNLPSPPYGQQSSNKASIVLDLADGAGMRWFEIYFPCGTIPEVEEIALREMLVGGSHAPVEYVNRTAEALLELAMRCDLVIDAHAGKLVMTPRGEWSEAIPKK
jgi:hypothetical protein